MTTLDESTGAPVRAEEATFNAMIYALKGSADIDILSSLQKGEGRFGWSYTGTADLRVLQQRIQQSGWEALTADEQDCYQGFLLDLRANDHVVYINVPEHGQCTVARVTGEYFWRHDDEDFNHRFAVDPASVQVFDRNAAFVHPALRARLRLQGRWWRIYLKEEFAQLLNVINGKQQPASVPQSNAQFLSKEIQPLLLEITRRVHHTHPNVDLEALLAAVFRQIPQVTDVRWQGGRGDHGADLIVTFQSGLPVPGLERQSKLLVQVKSYRDTHGDLTAVEDIRRAFARYPDADMGLIISSADSAAVTMEEALDSLREEVGRPIALLIGADVGAFYLRFGNTWIP